MTLRSTRSKKVLASSPTLELDLLVTVLGAAAHVLQCLEGFNKIWFNLLAVRADLGVLIVPRLAEHSLGGSSSRYNS